MNRKRKYFSTVVKMLHSWRDYAKKIKADWVAVYGYADAQRYVGARPPLALSGRWGTTEGGEAFILAPGHDKVWG